MYMLEKGLKILFKERFKPCLRVKFCKPKATIRALMFQAGAPHYLFQDGVSSVLKKCLNCE